jgi:hypothetical protein
LVFSGIVAWPLGLFLEPMTLDAVTATFVAPLVEEPSKAVFLLIVALSAQFDNTTDGFVYGAAVGLGFGMTENFLYFVDVGSTGDFFAWAGTVVVRTLYSALMHACATSVVGATLGFAKFRSWGFKLVLVPVGLAVAMGIHALWNGLLSLDGLLGADGSFAVLDFLLFPLEFAGLFVTLQICLWTERSMIIRELTDEAERGLLPLDHVPILASTIKRGRRGWLPPGVSQSAYVKTATTLAFRKHQARAKPELQGDVDVLREKLRALS